MIQDIGSYAFDNAYRPLEARPEDYVLAYGHGQAVVRLDGGTGELELPRLRDWGFSAPDLAPRYLFSIDDRRFFMAERDPRPRGSEELPEGFRLEPVNQFRFLRPRCLAFAGITGYQLRNWYHSNRYCGHCGSELGHVATSRELACPACGNVLYPKICPAVIVGITNGDELVMTKYAGRAYNHYALVAGFVEVGETLEQCVAREVREEVGLRVKNVRYYKSQPWSFTDTLLAGFFCDVDGDPTIHVDHDELQLGGWVRRADVPLDPADDSSLTNEMIALFARGGEPRA